MFSLYSDKPLDRKANKDREQESLIGLAKLKSMSSQTRIAVLSQPTKESKRTGKLTANEYVIELEERSANNLSLIRE